MNINIAIANHYYASIHYIDTFMFLDDESIYWPRTSALTEDICMVVDLSASLPIKDDLEYLKDLMSEVEK